MSLPSQDQKESYTADEVQHLIAREWAKNEILTLKAGHMELQKQLVEFMGTNQADSKALRDMLAGFPVSVAAQIDRCRKDMRHEIEQDFLNKMEAMRMEQRIEEKIGETDKTLGKQISELDKKMDANLATLANQIKEQWLKVSVAVSTIVCLGGLATWYFTTGRQIVGG